MQTAKVDVLILYSITDKNASLKPLVDGLRATGHFNLVDTFDAAELPKNKEILSKYDAVLVMALDAQENKHEQEGWPEPDLLGNILADAVLFSEEQEQEKKKKGCGVVLGPLTHWQVIGGKWRTHKLSPLLPGRLKATPHLVIGKKLGPLHAVFEEVNSFAGGDESYHVSAAINEAGATSLARWSDGFPLLAILDDHTNVERGQVISMNFMPLPFVEKTVENEKVKTSYWDDSTDGYKLISNALRFVAHPTYQSGEGDLVCQHCVDLSHLDPRQTWTQKR